MRSWKAGTASSVLPNAKRAATVPPRTSLPCFTSPPANSACPSSNSTENSREPEKLQASNFKRTHQRGLSGRQAGSSGRRRRDIGLVWRLKFGGSLELGAWRLELLQ